MADVVSLSDLESVPHATVFEEPPARTVRLELAADQRVPAHSHPDTVIVLHLVSGQLELRLDEDHLELAAGDIVRFSGNREIAPRAITDAAAVLVFCPAPVSGTDGV